LERFGLRRIGGDAAIIIGGSLVANAFNYLFHFLISRRLGPEDYGTLATLTAAATIIGVFGSTVGVVAMQDAAKLLALGREDRIAAFVRHVAPAAFGVALAIAVLVFAGSFLVGPYLHIVRLAIWSVFALYLVVAIFAGFFRGATQGAHHFGLFAVSNVSDTAVKLGSALLMVSAGLAVVGAVGGLLAGALVGLAVVALPLTFGHAGPPAEGEHDHLELSGRAVSVFWISASVMVLLFADQLFAKHHLSGTQAGLYAAAGTIARAIPFAIGMIALVMWPRVAAAQHVSRESLRHLLAVAFGAGAAIALAGLAFTTFAPAQLLGITYGTAFVEAAGLLRIYGVAAALLGIAALGIGYLQAVGNYGITRALSVAVAIEAVLMALFGTTGQRLLGIAILVNAALLPAIALEVAASLRAAPQAPDPLADELALVHEPRIL
jgi:O-antigen/teichoic acid export membrane protein